MTQVHRANFDNTIISWQNIHKGQYVAFLSTKKARKLKAGKFCQKKRENVENKIWQNGIQ